MGDSNQRQYQSISLRRISISSVNGKYRVRRGGHMKRVIVTSKSLKRENV